jgi:hypothetical protein
MYKTAHGQKDSFPIQLTQLVHFLNLQQAVLHGPCRGKCLGGEQLQDVDTRVSLSPLNARVLKVICNAVILLHHAECLSSRLGMLHDRA